MLAVLTAPFAIKSSRFFQTKLSHPPRIIAFVRYVYSSIFIYISSFPIKLFPFLRLETREAAEEIIERLHGRMVRDWDDRGSRISVRFADTSEQRELRVRPCLLPFQQLPSLKNWVEYSEASALHEKVIFHLRV